MRLTRQLAINGGLVEMTLIATACLAVAQPLAGQSIQFPWSGFAHTPQHDCVSSVPVQPLSRIKWTMPVTHGVPAEFTHFSAPVVTRSNTVIFPMNLTNTGYNFRLEALAGATGLTNWEQPTDYSYLPVAYQPVCPLALTPANRLYFAATGGTVFSCDTPDATALPTFTRAAFYGLTNYMANTNAFASTVYICTPITSDRYGDIFFGFRTAAASPLGTQGGLARIDFDGAGSWIVASNAVGTTNVSQPAVNCAPALSQDQKTIYASFVGSSDTGDTTEPWCYLTAMDSRTLAPLASALLIDPKTTNNANVVYYSTASPTVGPDGDVFFGVLENPSGDNYYRGWLLHFDSSLSVAKTPGLFGWDVTDSIINASLVPSYGGNSAYLLATKYNDYGTRQYSMAILDPQQGIRDSQTGVTVMATVLTIPSGGMEWCVNSASVDPFTRSVLANNEDGYLYRWDLTRNQLIERIALTTTQSGEAYTPTVIGVDGTVYAINHGYLFAAGQ